MTRVFLSRSRDIFTNLAAEEWLLWNGPDRCLLLYSNSPAVVIGRNQNPWTEANLHFLHGSRVPLARRFSGGGAVYHDLGNLNYSFLQRRDAFSKHTNAETLSLALAPLLHAHVVLSPRGDLLVHQPSNPSTPRKFSGTAYRMSRDRVCHHGTVLVNSHLPTLRAALNPPSDAFEALKCMGTASVRASVANLAALGINHPLEMEHVITALVRQVGADDPEDFDAEMICREEHSAAETRAKLTSHQWVVGETPKFTARFHIPDPTRLTLDVHVRKGAIIESVHPDFSSTELDTATISALQHNLAGCHLDAVSLSDAVPRGHRLQSTAVSSLAQWFRGNVPPSPVVFAKDSANDQDDNELATQPL